MRIVVAPDEFGGTMSALTAANAIASGWARSRPNDELLLRPVSDGGPGFLEVLHATAGGHLLEVAITGPIEDPVKAQVLLVDDADGRTAYVESAQAVGRALLSEPAPLRASSVGLGELINHAVAAGATRIVVGLGGTGTTDAGAGLLAALGARGVGASMSAGGGDLNRLSAVDLTGVPETLGGVTLVLATDVDSPLLGSRGAAHVFAAQKGATPEQVELLESNLAHFAALVGRTPDGRDPAVTLGAGAAGGIGYALLWLGATRVAGIELVLQAIGLREAIGQADLVVTGEGTFDWQSLRGKVVTGVAAAAMELGRPTLILAGQVLLDRREFPPGVAGARGVADLLGSVEAAIADPAAGLAALAARAALTWSPG